MGMSELQYNSMKASQILKAMANERRLLILSYLTGGELSVSQLEAMLDLSQSALSQHLARLRRDGLVQTRREAQTIYYSLSCEYAEQVMSMLGQMFHNTIGPAPEGFHPSQRFGKDQIAN
ncbi:MAG: metalloregulator ArsR/SmtB family transcription factor [Alphaproteobacteria bacterium]